MPSEISELAIAGFYDGIYLFYERANSFLTFGLDLYWRRSAARLALEAAPGARSILDVCCGTGDFTMELRRTFGPNAVITGADLSETMLSLARPKDRSITFIRAESKSLPFPDGEFDLVSLSFAARNLNIDKEKLLASLREFRRVLKTGGIFLNLETTRPANPVVRGAMGIYVKTLIGLLNLASPKHRASYSFLKTTVLRFYSTMELDALLMEAGFSSTAHKTLFPGAVAVHTAIK